MPTLLAYFSVRYVWDLPADVFLLPVDDPRNVGETYGTWYIHYDILNYVDKDGWKTVIGKEDGFENSWATDMEITDD